MNMIAMNMDRTIHGMAEYFRSDKTVVLLIAVLLYLWLKEKKNVDNKVNRLLLYTLVMTGILLFPITAMIMVIYQTAFYDYAWTWSMVPGAAVSAYGISIFLMDMENLSKKKIVPVAAVIACILLVCGNQGTIRTNEKVVEKGQIEVIAEHAVKEAKAGRVEFRADKGACMQVPVGKLSFDADALCENALAVIRALYKAKPASAKGVYIQSFTVSATMTPGIKVDPREGSKE